MPRYFTLDEARATLPTIRELVQRLRDLKGRFDQLQALLGSAEIASRGNGHLGAATSDGRTELAQLAREANDAVQEITDTGCQVKDIDTGLIDWPSIRDDHEVYLCWRFGESDILYWHEIADGFAGRQSL